MTTPGSSRMFASIDRDRMGRHTRLALILIYALAAGLDSVHHLADDLHKGNHAIEFSEVAVAYAAGLFWPADIIAGALLRIG